MPLPPLPPLPPPALGLPASLSRMAAALMPRCCWSLKGLPGALKAALAAVGRAAIAAQWVLASGTVWAAEMPSMTPVNDADARRCRARSKVALRMAARAISTFAAMRQLFREFSIGPYRGNFGFAHVKPCRSSSSFHAPSRALALAFTTYFILNFHRSSIHHASVCLTSPLLPARPCCGSPTTWSAAATPESQQRPHDAQGYEREDRGRGKADSLRGQLRRRGNDHRTPGLDAATAAPHPC